MHWQMFSGFVQISALGHNPHSIASSIPIAWRPDPAKRVSFRYSRPQAFTVEPCIKSCGKSSEEPWVKPCVVVPEAVEAPWVLPTGRGPAATEPPPPVMTAADAPEDTARGEDGSSALPPPHAVTNTAMHALMTNTCSARRARLKNSLYFVSRCRALPKKKTDASAGLQICFRLAATNAFRRSRESGDHCSPSVSPAPQTSPPRPPPDEHVSGASVAPASEASLSLSPPPSLTLDTGDTTPRVPLLLATTAGALPPASELWPTAGQSWKLKST